MWTLIGVFLLVRRLHRVVAPGSKSVQGSSFCLGGLGFGFYLYRFRVQGWSRGPKVGKRIASILPSNA